MRTYTLSFNNYHEAIHALRKLRKRGVQLHMVIVVVSVPHWNKVKDLMNGSGKMVLVFVPPHPY